MKRFMFKILIASAFGVGGVEVQHTFASIAFCMIGWILFEIYDKKVKQ